MTIDKEIRQGISPQDSAILKLARNQVELDELIEAREFLEALEKAREEALRLGSEDPYFRDNDFLKKMVFDNSDNKFVHDFLN